MKLFSYKAGKESFMICLPKDSVINVLKVNTLLYPNCLEEHIKVIEEKGHCWFARIGKNIKSQPLNNRYVLFYQKGTLFLGYYVSREKSIKLEDIPNSYDKYIFEKSIVPEEYILLESLFEVPVSLLDKLKYKGNGRIISNTITRSPRAYIRAICTEDILIESAEKKDGRF